MIFDTPGARSALLEAGDGCLQRRAFIPAKLSGFFQPHRYKVAWGGRGSAKSWTIAAILIGMAASRPIRWLCAREIQLSIAESVHALLVAQIERLGLQNHFEVTKTAIYGRFTGSKIFFAGVKSNPAKLKSMEGLDGIWLEEAESISEMSWQIIIPTLRKAGSEIWCSMNPNEETDPTFQRFLVPANRPVDAMVVECSWRDNPWFPEVLRAEKDWLARVDPEAYQHVWEGSCRAVSDAEIFRGKYIVEEIPAELWRKADRVFYGADFGFAVDPSVLMGRLFMLDNRLYVPHEAWGLKVELDNMPALYDTVPGSRDWPIKADGSRPETISKLASHGFNITAADKWEGCVEDGIEHLRSFEKIVIAPECKHTIFEMRHYRFKVDQKTGQVLPIVVDRHNHCCIAEGEIVDTLRGPQPIEHVVVGDMVVTRDGWRVVRDAWCAGERELWEVRAGDRVLRATADHPIWTQRGFVRMDALRYDDDLLIAESPPCREPKSGSIEAEPIGAIRMPATKARASISGVLGPAARACFTAMSGWITSAARCLMAGTSITSTRIQGTMILETSSASAFSSTSLGTRFSAIDSRGISSAWIEFGRSPRRGTRLRRAWNSIVASAPWPTMALFRSPSHASFVASNSFRAPSGIETCSAPTTANRNGVDRQASMMRRADARNAALNFDAIATPTPRLVRARVGSARALGAQKPVYDIAVIGRHEFVAGGILVSNCDSIRYALDGYITQGGAIGSWQRLGRSTHNLH